MYGDDEGNIAWWACAKLPVRPDHVDTKTAIDGTDPANEVQGWHPFAMNPQSVNPPAGYVYSANNAPDSVPGVYHPGHYYSGNTRGAGIIQAIESKDDWTLAEAQELQLDHHSPVYEKNCAMLLDLHGRRTLDENLEAAVGTCADGTAPTSADDTAPTLYYRWMYRAIEGAYYDEFEAAATDTAAGKVRDLAPDHHQRKHLPRLLANADSPWWDDVRTDLKESEPAPCSASPCSRPTKTSKTPSDRTWTPGATTGSTPTTHKHAMTDVPVLGDWLNVGPYGLPAAKDALCKYEFKLKRDVDYSIFSGPSKRIGIDFADVDGAESILPTGQSGNVFSPFYDNQAPLYHAGQFRKMRMDRADIEAHTTAVASIRPQTER